MANRKLSGGAMSVKRKSIITILAAFLCALLCAVSFGLLRNGQNIADAQSAGSMTPDNTITIGEITFNEYEKRADGKVFNAVELSKLFNALTGTSGSVTKSITDVANTISGSKAYGVSGRTVNLPAYKTAKDLYTLNGNKNIVLSFGGDEWTVTFLTTDANGHVIATLWLTDLYKDEGGANVYTAMGWATTTSGTNAGGNQATGYPGDMYSTSQARVQTLNAGGVIAATPGNTGTAVPQNPESHWAKFTMSNADLSGSTYQGQSLTAYITQPKDVMYQYYENWQYQWANVSGNSSTYPLHNEALSGWQGDTASATAVTTVGWYSNFNYTGKTVGATVGGVTYTNETAYDAWGNDYLWLPSLSETGRIAYSTIAGAEGFWQTTYKNGSSFVSTGQITHTAAASGVNPNTSWTSVTDNTDYAWLRTGSVNFAYYAVYLSGSGGDNVAYPARKLAVRPALHLDLTSAAQAAAFNTPVDVSQYVDSENEKKDIQYNSANDFSSVESFVTAMGYDWYDFASFVQSVSINYKDWSDETDFTTAKPGTVVTKIHNAGRYQVTLTLKTGLPFSWYAIPTGGTGYQATTTMTILLTVNQQELKYKLQLFDYQDNEMSNNTLPYDKDHEGYVDYVYELDDPIASSDTGSLAPDIVILYYGVDVTYPTPHTEADPDDPTQTVNVTKTETFPQNAGGYKAELTDKNEKTSNYKLVISGEATNPYSFTISKKTITTPTASTATKTYTSLAQDFQFSNFDPEVLKITSIKADTTALTQDTTDKTKWADTKSRYEITVQTTTPYKMTATNAAKYVLTFEIIDVAPTVDPNDPVDYDRPVAKPSDNYAWATTVKDKTLTFTMDKATITMTLTPPSDANNQWSWPDGTEGNITKGQLSGVKNNDPLTFDTAYYKLPDSGDPSPSYDQTKVAFDDIEFDVTLFDQGSADYYIHVYLADDSDTDNGDADVNRNYKFATTDSNYSTPLENVFVRKVEVGSGEVSAKSLVWTWQLTASGNPTKFDDDTELVYSTDKDGSAQKYIVKLSELDLPEYLMVDVTMGTNGYTAGYKDNEQSTAGDKTSYVYLTIKSDSDYTFVDTGDHGYTYVDDTHAYVKFEWTIEKKELDFSEAVWQFSTNASGENDSSATWKDFSEKDFPEYTGTGFIYIRLSPDYLEDLGLTPSGADQDIVISYGGTNKQILAKTETTTNVSVTKFTNTNYKLPEATNGVLFQYKWQVSNKQINLEDWSGTRTVTATDADGETKAYSFPVPNVSNNDGTDYADMFEYTYSYTIDGVEYTDRTEAQMIQDVYSVASLTNQIYGSVTVKLRSPYDKTYDINPGSLSTSYAFTCGASLTVVEVTVGGTHVEYGDGGDFGMTATYYPGNVTDLPQANFIAENGQNLQVTLTDKDGQVMVFTANNAGNPDVLEFVLNAGSYKAVLEITDENVASAYALEKSTFTFTVAPKEITIPMVVDALTYNGGEITFVDHLDSQYSSNIDMIDVTGDTWAIDVSAGSYSVTLILTDTNYCWVLPEDTAAAVKVSIRYSLADGEIATTYALSPDSLRVTYSWNVAPLIIDASKMWGKNANTINITPELQKLQNAGLVDVAYRYYDEAGLLIGDTAEGFKPEAGQSYRIEAYLTGDAAGKGDVVFKNADNSLTDTATERVLYSEPKGGVAKLKDALTKKYMGLPLWLWIVIGVCALIFLIVLICIIVAACKKKKKKKEEAEAKAEKEEAKAAAAAAAAAPMLAMSASMADEKAKLEAEKAKMEAELAKAKMEAEADAARAKAQAEADAAKAKAQAELDLQKAKNEAEIARMRAEAEAEAARAKAQAQQIAQPAPAPAPQPMPQPQYQQQPQYMPQPQPQYMPQPQPQYMPMPMPQPAPQPAPQASGGNSSVEHMLMEMKAQQAISEAKNEAQFRIMHAENKAAQEVAEAKAQARQNNNQQMPYPPMMGMNPMMGMGMMNPMMGMGMAMPAMGMGYPQQQPAPQQANGNSPVILTIGPNGEVKQIAPNAAQPAAPAQPAVQPILINLGSQQAAAHQPAVQEQAPAQQAAPAPAAAEAQPLSAQYPPGAVVTTTTTVDTTKTSSDVPEIRRRRNEENDIFDIDGFYDKYDGNN